MAEVDDPECPREVDLGREVDLEPGPSERPPESDRLGQQPPSIDRLAGGREEDRRIARIARQRRRRMRHRPDRATSDA